MVTHSIDALKPSQIHYQVQPVHNFKPFEKAAEAYVGTV
jgi:hypothetical protein